MFARTDQKLEDARSTLAALSRSTTQLDYKAQFLAFINAARAITYAMQAEGAHVSGFDEWYEPRREQMRQDPVSRYVHEARISDFHRGQHDLEFQSLALHRIQVWEHSPHPDAQLQITSQGPSWVIQRADGRQDRYPADVSVVAEQTVVLRGAPIEDPIGLCSAALQSYERLVSELHERFG